MASPEGRSDRPRPKGGSKRGCPAAGPEVASDTTPDDKIDLHQAVEAANAAHTALCMRDIRARAVSGT